MVLFYNSKLFQLTTHVFVNKIKRNPYNLYNTLIFNILPLNCAILIGKQKLSNSTLKGCVELDKPLNVHVDKVHTKVSKDHQGRAAVVLCPRLLYGSKGSRRETRRTGKSRNI